MFMKEEEEEEYYTQGSVYFINSSFIHCWGLLISDEIY